MTLSLSPALENDLSSMHAILTICGEHMYRTQGMSHWYPYKNFEIYSAGVQSGDVYAIYDDETLVGTFYVTEKMREWYSTVAWADWSHKALYFGGFGVLPLAQGRGIGKWVMTQVDALAIAGDFDALRFDGVAGNPSLMKFYTGLGYQQRGILETPYGNNVMTYERLFMEAE